MKNNTITAPKGFLAAGVRCGIKKSGRADLGLLVCPAGAKVAAVFTTNRIESAAVTVCRKHVKSPTVYAVVVNSGNANTCTGRVGLKNAIRMCSETAHCLSIVNRQSAIGNHNVLVASTGIIGHQLPMGKIKAGITMAAAELSGSPQAGLDFARAIMTTDTRYKQAVRHIEISGAKVTVAGTVKGAGMIAPRMATTLLFITTDVAISKPLLGQVLKGAISNSLNKLTVDGHQSTNDTAIILASGLAGNNAVIKRGSGYRKFSRLLADLCGDLARQMALDAEGATRMFKVVVTGAADGYEAAKAARAIADYPLVKCAVNGGDPNWGRIVCAVGSCGVKLSSKKLSCRLGAVTVFKDGRPTRYDAKRATKVISGREHTITVDLGVGRATDFCFGCDLSRQYVRINADYHT